MVGFFLLKYDKIDMFSSRTKRPSNKIDVVINIYRVGKNNTPISIRWSIFCVQFY